MYKDVIYNSNFNALLAVSSNVTEIEYHPNVNSIENGAFSTSILKYIKLPDSITKIGKWGLVNIKFLEILILSPNVKILDKYTFGAMPKLKEIIIPEGVETISASCFYSIRNLNHITLPSNVTIAPNAFNNFYVKKAFIIDQNKKYDYINAGIPATAFQPDSTCPISTLCIDLKVFLIQVFILL